MTYNYYKQSKVDWNPRLRCNPKICAIVRAVAAGVALSFFVAGACAQERPPYAETYRRGLPPVGAIVEYEHGTFPPKPKGRQITNRPLELGRESQVVAPDQVRLRRLKAQGDSRVRQALGSRFAFINGGKRELAKGQIPIAAPPLTTLCFYSYSRKRAYEVRMSGDDVVEIIPLRKGYQPPASREEVEAAAKIVKSDTRFTNDAAGLFVRGILTPSADGNRHLYLLFYKSRGLQRGRALFQATVDMTAGNVVSARPVKP